MIRPWYRSRLFWAWIPGLLFLLWAWWDSGAYRSSFTVEGHAGEPVLHTEFSTGNFLVRWQRAKVPLSPLQWTFIADRWGLGENDPITRALVPRPRQFDVAPALLVKEERDGLGKNPAAAGWVPSPGRSLPLSKLMLLEYQLAWWLVVLAYLLGGTLFIACWQYWKARRRERRGGPRAVISLRFWLPFLFLLGLTACFFDSFCSRTRGWVGKEKYHVGWSHYRGLFIASFFYDPLADAALNARIIREPMGEAEFTSRRWPRWLGQDTSGENSWELRLPTTFTIGMFVVMWAGVACWRWQRRRSRLRKLPAAPP